MLDAFPGCTRGWIRHASELCNASQPQGRSEILGCETALRRRTPPRNNPTVNNHNITPTIATAYLLCLFSVLTWRTLDTNSLWSNAHTPASRDGSERRRRDEHTTRRQRPSTGRNIRDSTSRHIDASRKKQARKELQVRSDLVEEPPKRNVTSPLPNVE